MDHFCEELSCREINRSIIIDNNIYCYSKHLTNGIPIPKYEGSQSEEEPWLTLLADYLIENFSETSVDSLRVDDFRKIICKDFGFEKIIESTRTSQIRQMMTK